jgi:hypothetical protein
MKAIGRSQMSGIHKMKRDGQTDERTEKQKNYMYISPYYHIQGIKKNLAIWLSVACSKNKTNNILRK